MTDVSLRTRTDRTAVQEKVNRFCSVRKRNDPKYMHCELD